MGSNYIQSQLWDAIKYNTYHSTQILCDVFFGVKQRTVGRYQMLTIQDVTGPLHFT